MCFHAIILFTSRYINQINASLFCIYLINFGLIFVLDIDGLRNESRRKTEAMIYRHNNRTEGNTKWLTATLIGIYVLIASFLAINSHRESQDNSIKSATDNNNIVITSK